jgi:hypothetical protein
MALFNECMQSCAHIVLDTADIVRDGDFSPAIALTPLRIGNIKTRYACHVQLQSKREY